MDTLNSFILSDLDEDIKKNIPTGLYFGKQFARFDDNTIIQRKVSRRLKQLKLGKNDYFKLLGFEGFYDGHKFDDTKISNFIKYFEDKDHPGWIPRDQIPHCLYDWASRSHVPIEDFVAFYKYRLETESLAQSYRTATERYREDIIKNLRIKNGKYVISNNLQIRNILVEFAHNRGFKYQEYLNSLINYWIDNQSFDPSLLNTEKDIVEDQKVFSGCDLKITDISEDILEKLLDAEDDSAGYVLTDKFRKDRRYSHTRIVNLKRHYAGACQICGEIPSEAEGVIITEAHHIEPFCRTCNNRLSNIIIVCPNHHRILHKLNARYNRAQNEFLLENGKKLKIILDHHLR